MSPRWKYKPIEKELRKAIEILGLKRKQKAEELEKVDTELYDLLKLALEEGASQVEMAQASGIKRANLRKRMVQKGMLIPKKKYSAKRNIRERKEMENK